MSTVLYGLVTHPDWCDLRHCSGTVLDGNRRHSTTPAIQRSGDVEITTTLVQDEDDDTTDRTRVVLNVYDLTSVWPDGAPIYGRADLDEVALRDLARRATELADAVAEVAAGRDMPVVQQ